MKLSTQLQYSLFALLITLVSWNVFAAACCGGSISVPSLITSDDKSQLVASYTYNQVVIDSVDNKGYWRTWDSHQSTQTLQLSGASLVSDRWQAGTQIPIVQRSQVGHSSSGLGDVSLSTAYEYLPDWDYNPFRPHGFGFLQLTLPTGKSKYESENGGLDSRGNGFLTLGLGTVLVKNIRKFDLMASFEIHKSMEKEFSNSQMSGRLQPGFGGSFGIGGGYSIRAWRLGSSLTWFYEDPVNIVGTTNVTGSVERYATFVASTSYLVNDDWSGVVSYSDQTIFGAPINTSLGRGVSVSLLRRWPR